MEEGERKHIINEIRNSQNLEMLCNDADSKKTRVRLISNQCC